MPLTLYYDQVRYFDAKRRSCNARSPSYTRQTVLPVTSGYLGQALCPMRQLTDIWALHLAIHDL